MCLRKRMKSTLPVKIGNDDAQHSTFFLSNILFLGQKPIILALIETCKGTPIKVPTDNVTNVYFNINYYIS
jgi:hypothetical protein